MLVLHDLNTLSHTTVELLGAKIIPALESPQRIEAIIESLQDSHHELRAINAGSPTDLLEIIKKTHEPGYVRHIETVHDDWLAADLISQNESVLPECFRLQSLAQPNPSPPKDIFARAGYYAFDMSSGICSGTYQSAIASANLAYQGTKLLISTKTTPPPPSVLALCRPPGHHCDGARTGGYCYLNNAAIAISTYHASLPSVRTAILDLDFHHGNGSQELFYTSQSPLYISIHGADEFPYYTGAESETGSGPGEGYNLNLPLKPDSPAEEYLEKLEIALTRLVEYRVEFLVVSLGFDTFHLDPLGSFKLETGDYEVIARRTRERTKGIPALIVLEGGYVVEALGNNLLSFLKGWEDSEGQSIAS